MKYIVALFLTFLLAFALSLYLPWYAIAIAAFVVAVCIHQSPFKAFSAGFVGIFLLWAVVSFYLNWQNKSLLSTKMANLFPLDGEGFGLLVIAALIGGAVGGTAALTGSYFRRILS